MDSDDRGFETIGEFCDSLPVDVCARSKQCAWFRDACIPDAARVRKDQRKDAMRGWKYFLGAVVAGLLVVSFALSQIGVDVTTYGMVGSVNVGAALLVLLVSLGVLRMLRKCDWSLGCFFLGGEAGREEQEVNNAKLRKARTDAQRSAVVRESGMLT